MIILESARLRLREMSLTDLDFVASMLAHPEVMRYYPKIYSRDEAREWVERQVKRYSENGHGFWLVERRDSGEPVGQVGLLSREFDGRLEREIGYLIHRPFWRQGLATEAAMAVRDQAFGERGLAHVISLIRPENLPSQGVARNLGMSPEREMEFNNYRHLVFVARRAEIELRS